MANATAGTIVVGSPQSLTGVLFQKTNPDTPLFNRMATVKTDHLEYIMGAEYSLESPGLVTISEDASLIAPAPKKTAQTNNKNRTQIFQRTVQETYRSMGNYGQLTSSQPAFVGATNNRPDKLATEKAIQLAQMRRDIEYTILNGTYHESTGTADADQTRGLLQAITSNTIAAGGAPLDYTMLCDMGKKLTAEFPDGLENTLCLIDATTAAQLSQTIANSNAFVGSQTQFGANAQSVLTPFGVVNFLRLSNAYLPAGTAVFANMGALKNVIQEIPGKGFFFFEDLAKTGAGTSAQIYGEWGLDYGVEWIHGKITGLSTTVPAATAPQVYVANAGDFLTQGEADVLKVNVENTSVPVTVGNTSLGVTVNNTVAAPVNTKEVPAG